MITYKEWKLCEAEESIDQLINREVETAIGDIQAEIKKYLASIAPTASDLPVDKWGADKAGDVKNYLNQPAASPAPGEKNPSRLDRIGKLFGLDKEAATSKTEREELEKKRQELIGQGKSEDEAKTLVPNPTRRDKLNKFLGKTGGFMDKIRDRFGWRMKAEWDDFNSFLANLVETKDLQNLLFQCGVKRTLLAEADLDREKVVIQSVKQRLVDLGKNLKRVIDKGPETAPERSTSPEPSASAANPANAPRIEPEATPAAETGVSDLFSIALEEFKRGHDGSAERFLQRSGVDKLLAAFQSMVSQVEKATGTSLNLSPKTIGMWAINANRTKRLSAKMMEKLGGALGVEVKPDLATPAPAPAPAPAPEPEPASEPAPEPAPEPEPTIPGHSVLEPVPTTKPEDDLGWRSPSSAEVAAIRKLSHIPMKSGQVVRELLAQKVDPFQLVRVNPNLKWMVGMAMLSSPDKRIRRLAKRL